MSLNLKDENIRLPNVSGFSTYSKKARRAVKTIVVGVMTLFLILVIEVFFILKIEF